MTQKKLVANNELSLRLEKALPQIKWQADFPLKQLSYFKVGGPAAVYALIKKETQLAEAVNYLAGAEIPYVVVGGLSNLIPLDKGYAGAVLQNATQDFARLDEGGEAEEDSDRDEAFGEVYVSSGWRLGPLVQKLIGLGLGGLESFMSLPGTLGGAIYNNAHFQKEFIADGVKTVKVFDPRTGEVWELPANQAEFGYDTSIFQKPGHEEWLILGATLQLRVVEPAEAQTRARAAAQWRLERQPLNLPSSGCIFQNTPNTARLRELFPQFAEQEMVPSGFLIDHAGLKGKIIGGMQISEKHAAFIVNLGSGTAQDVIELINLIKTEIRNKYQVELKEEVFYL